MAKDKPAYPKRTAQKTYLPREPDNLKFVIQLNEPKIIRRDILEALREIIIFMQGYETFVKIQREKVETFNKLKEDAKSLNSFVDNRLRKLLPKGKLKGIVKDIKPKIEERREREEAPVSRERFVVQPEPKEESGNELDDLEYQLADIENRLRNLS